MDKQTAAMNQKITQTVSPSGLQMYHMTGKFTNIPPFVRILGVLLLIDVLCISVLFGAIHIMKSTVIKIKEERSKNYQLSGGSGGGMTTEQLLISKQSDIDMLEAYLAKEEQVIDFIQALDDMKSNGVIINFSFISDDLVKDTLGLYVLPFYIELAGDKEHNFVVISQIQSLPFLTRIITAEYRKSSEVLETGRIGGVLYVSKRSK